MMIDKYPYNKLTEYFIENNNIDENTQYEIFTIPALDLIQENRIDLLAKIAYIVNREAKLESQFLEEVYIKHIEAFSDGKFIEEGSEHKNSIVKYMKSFDETIDSIKINGFDSEISLIPVGQGNILLDGAHRVAACAYFSLNVTCIQFKHCSRQFNLNYFQKHLLSEPILDYLCNELCKKSDSTYCLCFWPTVYNHRHIDNIESKIHEKLEVLYKKEVNLNYNGLRNFMIQVYRQHSWLGCYENHFEGVYGQLDPCYVKDKPIRIYFVKSDSPEKVLALKKEIRELLNLGNYSVHSTDNKEETCIMADLVLNKNSVDFMNYGKPDAFVLLGKKLQLFKQHVTDQNQFIIDSSSILGMYGIREPEDLDFITLNQEFMAHDLLSENDIHCHNNYIQYFNKPLLSLFYDPQNYFIFDSLRFITLKNLISYKQNRNENKDKDDVKLIASFISNNYEKKISLIEIKTRFKKWKRNTVFQCRQVAKKVLKFLGVHGWYRGIIDKRNKK